MGKKQAQGGAAYRQKSDCIDGKLIILGVSHDCDMIRYGEEAVGCKR